MTWDEMTEAYLRELRARLRSLSLCASYRGILARFQRFCASHKVHLVEQICLEHLLHFAQGLEELRLKASTRYMMLGVVRRWLKWAAYRGHIVQDPAARWHPRHPPYETIRQIPTEGEMLALLEFPAPDTNQGRRNLVLIELLYGTGLRLQECTDLQLEDLDLLHRTLAVKGKGGKPRCLPIGDKLAAKLQDYLSKDRPSFNPKPEVTALFVNSKGRAASRPVILGCIRSHCRRAQVFVAGVHSIRHAFATHLLLGGAPLWAVQRLLGHESVDCTAIYTRMLAIDVKRELARTHPRFKSKPRRPQTGNPES